MSKYIYIAFSLLLFSCYGINKETSDIFNLSFCCNSETTWTLIFKEHKVENIKNKDIQEILNDFKNQIHSTDIIYFREYPEEYIGISKNRMSIRYIYNKNIANQVLDGFSPQLNDSEKIRIGLRISALQMGDLNEKGKRDVIMTVQNECSKYLKKHEKP